MKRKDGRFAGKIGNAANAAWQGAQPVGSKPGEDRSVARHKTAAPGVTEPALVLHSPNSRLIPHQVPARFRPRTMTDSPALHPLHFTAAIRKQRRIAIVSFRRSQTGETVKNHRARPM
jgi:hypothetical protein